MLYYRHCKGFQDALGGIQVQLSNRQIKLVAQLLMLNNAITTKTLAEQFSVSVRTIKNDLKGVQEWFAAYGEYYRSKPRIGVWIQANHEQKNALKEQLLHGSTISEHIATPQERVEQIILLFTVTGGFITTQQIENKVAISKNTVIADLDKVEHYLQQYQLQLERKNYYGYRIRGSELNIRSVVEAILNQALSYYESPILMSSNPLKDIDKIHFQIVPELQNVLTTITDELKTSDYLTAFDFNSDDVMTMVIRMMISVVRLSMNRPINSYTPLSPTIEDKATLPYKLFSSIIQHYDFPMLNDEYDYLLRGVNPRFDDQNIARLTRQIIKAVGQQTGQAFVQDSQLQVNLFSHLLTKLSNKYKFTNEYNPFVKDLKKRNLHLFEAVHAALREYVSSNPAVINDSFVAFVTLHFLVSMDGKHITKNARIIYVCSTGLGVTSLIKKEIERNISNVEIAGFASMNNVGEKIAALKPDLLVSIFPITRQDIPVIQVNPLPSPDDLRRIQEAVAQILDVKPDSLTQVSVGYKGDDTVEDITHTLLLTGTVIYNELWRYLRTRIQESYQEAFMIHIMMAVHRIYFHHSYDAQMASLKDVKAGATDVQKIKEIFSHNQLDISTTEISAILQYTRMGEMGNKEDD
ncbi:hypothetical protein C6Y10_00120 [Lactiplantibacillus pentosus]|nr:hypothetical protein C6Y10_00120 [Lactiplantibacillus pentosus]